MKVRLFLDEDVHFALADALRKRGYDARHTGEEMVSPRKTAPQTVLETVN